MSYKDKGVNWNQLVQFSKDGMFVADYQQIRSAVTERFKQIYGEDIDLATTSADGVYVETLCLIISNILQSFKQFYAQLDVRTATGKFLDSLCSLSNVYRKPETNSTCSINLTLDDSASNDYVAKEISLLDKNGNIWSCVSQDDMVFKPGVAKSIVVTCETAGPIRADAGWIDRLVQNDVVMTISQTDAAEIGSYAESDSELRARRNDSLGAVGSTVLEAMVGSLLAIDGITDVKVYNNDTGAEITSEDGTKIASHDVYVVLKKLDNVDISDSTICNRIYEKLTPGIRTTASSGSYGTAKSFQYVSSSLEQSTSPVFQMVYWKQAAAVHPTIVINLSKKSNFASEDNSTALTVAKNVIDYLNSLRLSSSVSRDDLWSVISTSDPLFRGKRTFSVNSIMIDATTYYTLKDCYFSYSEDNVKVSDSAVANIATITIS